MMIFDRLVNLISGLGTAKDKSAATRYGFAPLDHGQIEAAYRSDWIARKLIDIIPADMTREWRTWNAEEGEVEKIEAVERALSVQAKVRRAVAMGRLYGGAGIVMGDGASDPTQELRVDRIGFGGLRYLHVFTRRQLSCGQIVRDIESPWYGRPAYYEVTGTGDGRQVRLHPSRVVPFFGAPVPDEDHQIDGWSDSVLDAIHDAIQQASAVPAHVAALVPEARTDIISVPGLSERLSTEQGTTLLTSRFQNATLMRSMFNTLLLDATADEMGKPSGEQWQQKQLSFGDYPKLMETFLQIAAGAADIPVTRLLGQSPAGLSSTGDADLRNYYDNVGARQKVDLQPALAMLDEAIIRSALGDRPAEVWYFWNPLWQMSAKEKSEVAKSTAETAAIYAREGLVPSLVLSEGVKGRLIDDGTFPGIEAAYDEHGDIKPEDDEDALTNGAQGPSPAEVRRLRVAANDASPRTLYVHRKVKNGADIIAWAKRQGFTSTLEASDLHVTIAFSRQAVDWMAVGESWEDEIKIAAGGPRIMEQFGEATVLLIPGRSLKWRHEEIKEAGASWDHPEYQPHITISYGGAPADLSAVEAYQGEIVLGPEVFEELDLDWKAKVKETNNG